MEIKEKVNMKPERNITYDILRIIAIICVLYNHTDCYSIANRTVANLGLFLFYQSLALICRCGPPIFFMISGALLLGKNESFKNILVHRISRIICVMLLCTVLKASTNFTIIHFIETFCRDLNWYLYAYLGYLLMLPYLRMIAQHALLPDIKLYMGMVITFYTIGGILWVCKISLSFFDLIPIYNSTWGSWCWSIVFSLTGYFLSKEEVKNYFRKSYKSLIILAILLFVLFIVLSSIDIKENNAEYVDLIRQHGNFAPSVLIFYCAGYIKCNYNKIRKMIVSISGTAFGMFILDTNTGGGLRREYAQ